MSVQARASFKAAKESTNTAGKCEGPSCARPVYAKGLCQSHYAQVWRGEPLRALRWRSTNVEEALARKKQRIAAYMKDYLPRYKKAWRKRVEINERLKAQDRARRARRTSAARARDRRRGLERYRAGRDQLADWYVALTLCLTKSKCPAALIEAKRAQLKLHRLTTDMEETT